MKSFLLLAILLIFSATDLYAQPLKKVDSTITAYLQRISYLAEHPESDKSEDFDSLGNANALLKQYLIDASIKYPISIDRSYKSDNGLNIAIARDNKLCIYSWDTRLGGTMHIYNSVVVYQGAGGHIFTSDIPNESGTGGYYYSVITPVRTKDNSVLYLVFGDSRESTSERGEQVFAYKIVGDSISTFRVFKTKAESFNAISYYYNLFSFADKHPKAEVPYMHLSKNLQKLYIPIVDGEEITSKYLIYRFDGNNYVFDKNLKQ